MCSPPFVFACPYETTRHNVRDSTQTASVPTREGRQKPGSLASSVSSIVPGCSSQSFTKAEKL